MTVFRKSVDDYVVIIILAEKIWVPQPKVIGNETVHHPSIISSAKLPGLP